MRHRTELDVPRTPSRVLTAAGWRRHGGGWFPEPGDIDDPRRPPPGRAARHGIYTRPGPGGLTEWLAVYRGRPLFRWAGPRIGWSHPLVSPWNPILAQDLTFHGRLFGWPGDWEQWTADAIAAGCKAGGYFGIRPRWRHRAWTKIHCDSLAIGVHRGDWCHAARPGSLADAYGPDALAALAHAYRDALVPLGHARTADHVEADLADHATTRLLDLVVNHEDVPDVVRGLALGYPPEVTAGMWIHEHHHPGEVHSAETGAWCETTRRVTASESKKGARL